MITSDLAIPVRSLTGTSSGGRQLLFSPVGFRPILALVDSSQVGSKLVLR